jgi:hypothetical protein
MNVQKNSLSVERRAPTSASKGGTAWPSFTGKFLIYLDNFRQAAIFLASGLVSWLCPFDHLLWAARTMRRLKLRCKRPYANVTPSEVPPQFFAIHSDARSDRMLEARMQTLALHRPGRRWKPKVRWHGLEHLASALRRKSGAILWDSDFVYSRLITKMVFHQAGYPLNQLSQPGHGFVCTPFGVRFLNAYDRQIEDRFLERRIIINHDNTLDRLCECLAANKIANIRVVLNQARRRLTVSFFTNGKICIATGPAYLSYVSGAPLIPVFTIRGRDGIYDISVGPALDIPRASDVGPGFKVDYAGIIESYVDMLEVHVLEHPDQYRGWAATTWDHGS